MHHRAIDQHNIYHATLKAMKRAFLQLMAQNCPTPSKIIVDAMPLQLHATAYQDIDVLHFPFGERKSSSIAAHRLWQK